jgi:uncharacterized protein (DUF1800 family)
MKKLLCAVLIALPAYSQTLTAPATGKPLLTDRAAARFLDQASWGPTPFAISQLEQEGIHEWLNEQFQTEPSDLPDQPLLNSLGTSNTNLAPVTAVFFMNAVNNQDQLRQRMAFILSQMVVVSQVSVSNAYAFPPYWRLLRNNAFGGYRDILKAVTLSPAMGAYLNMANNNKANASKGTAANENYARELMQLFSMGLTVLNPDGTPALDASGNPVPTYTQADVTNLAKALTGWTYPVTPGVAAKTNNGAYYFGQMYAVEAEHDTTSKTIFSNITIPANQTAEQDLDSVLNAIMAQPTVAPFICKQLIQHMVTSNPSPAYVQHVSSMFTLTKGDMKSTIMAILEDPEARAGDNPSTVVNANFGHLREPLLFLTSMVRGLNGIATAANTLNSTSSNMNQNVFNPATVFSYFTPQFAQNGMLAPEFQIYTTQTAANRADAVNSAVYGTLSTGVTLNMQPFINLSGNMTTMLNYIAYVFLDSQMSSELQTQAAAAANAQTTSTAKAQAALYAVLTSSEYQVIH